MIPLPPFCSSFGTGSGGGDEFPVRDERFPQWTNQETRDLIEIRAQFEGDLNTAKRNNNQWATVSYRMREKGYRRTPDQCKYKWENLVNRYKGEEKADLDNSPRCPFFNELRAFFTSRANNLQQFQDEDEVGLTKAKKKLKTIVGDQSSNKLSEDDIPETDRKEILAPKTNVRKEKRQRNTNMNDKNSVVVLKEMLRDVSHQQQKIDMQWSESMGKCAQQREVFEQEWRQTMERLERERIVKEQAWWEKEEQWRMKEESRAEKRDALLTTLLDKLIHEDSN